MENTRLSLSFFGVVGFPRMDLLLIFFLIHSFTSCIYSDLPQSCVYTTYCVLLINPPGKLCISRARTRSESCRISTPPARAPVAVHHYAAAEKFSFRVVRVVRVVNNLWQKPLALILSGHATLEPAGDPRFHPLAAKLRSHSPAQSNRLVSPQPATKPFDVVLDDDIYMR